MLKLAEFHQPRSIKDLMVHNIKKLFTCVVPISCPFSKATFSTTKASAMTSDMSNPNVAKNINTQVRLVLGDG